MPNYRTDFLQICIANHILRFGEFTLKSGRVSPYFFNAGLFNNGQLLHNLSTAYAHLINEKLGGEFILYGPAYKGIPLAAATALQLSASHSRTVPYAFNRKEAKDHGEGGIIVGAELTGDVVIIDDVVTAGTSVNESIEIISRSGASVIAIIIALDRQEVADGESRSAVQKIEDQFEIPVHSIIQLQDLLTFLESDTNLGQFHSKVADYQKQYGFRSET